MLKHVMIDLETLGTVPGCVILSLGAVVFEPETHTLGEEFYAVLNTESCEAKYLRVEEGTVKWWAGQSPEARAVLDAAATGGALLSDALNLFNSWLAGVGPAKNLRLYGNGADFDNPILNVAYDAGGVKPYFPAYSGRCYRTLKSLDELLGWDYKAAKIERHGVHHNALDDAKAQATHLMDFVGTIKSGQRNADQR